MPSRPLSWPHRFLKCRSKPVLRICRLLSASRRLADANKSVMRDSANYSNSRRVFSGQTVSVLALEVCCPSPDRQVWRVASVSTPKTTLRVPSVPRPWGPGKLRTPNWQGTSRRSSRIGPGQRHSDQERAMSRLSLVPLMISRLPATVELVFDSRKTSPRVRA